MVDQKNLSVADHGKMISDSSFKNDEKSSESSHSASNSQSAPTTDNADEIVASEINLIEEESSNSASLTSASTSHTVSVVENAADENLLVSSVVENLLVSSAEATNVISEFRRLIDRGNSNPPNSPHLVVLKGPMVINRQTDPKGLLLLLPEPNQVEVGNYKCVLYVGLVAIGVFIGMGLSEGLKKVLVDFGLGLTQPLREGLENAIRQVAKEFIAKWVSQGCPPLLRTNTLHLRIDRPEFFWKKVAE